MPMMAYMKNNIAISSMTYGNACQSTVDPSKYIMSHIDSESNVIYTIYLRLYFCIVTVCICE